MSLHLQKITIICILFMLNFSSCEKKKGNDNNKTSKSVKYVADSKRFVTSDIVNTLCMMDSGFLEHKSLKEIFDIKKTYSSVPKLIRQKKDLIEKEIIGFDFSLNEVSNHSPKSNISTRAYYDNDKILMIKQTYNSDERAYILNYYFCYGKSFDLIYIENQDNIKEITNDTTVVMLRGIILKNNSNNKLYFLGGDYPIEPTLQASHQVIMILDKFLFPIAQIRKKAGNVIKVSNDFPYFLFQIAYGRNYKYLHETATLLNIVTSNNTKIGSLFELFEKRIIDNYDVVDAKLSIKEVPLWFYEGKNFYRN